MRKYSYPALTDICRGTNHRPLIALRALNLLKRAGALAKDYFLSDASRPFAFIDETCRPETLIYRAGGGDLEHVKLMLQILPTLKRVSLIDLGYTGEESKSLWSPAVSSRDIPFNDGFGIRYYNFNYLRNSLRLLFKVIEPLTENPSRPGRFQALVLNDGHQVKLDLIRADARLSRQELGIDQGPTIDLLNLPGYFGVLPRNPDFIKALAGDLKAGELAIIMRSELSLPAMAESRLEILGLDLLSLVMYQKAWDRQAELLDVSNLSSWCILRKI